jgi:hypothetical protein
VSALCVHAPGGLRWPVSYCSHAPIVPASTLVIEMTDHSTLSPSWVSGIQLRDREACALVEGRWMPVVTTGSQPGEVTAAALHPFAALRFNDGFVLAYECSTLPQDAMAICAVLDSSMRELFLRRALADRTDVSILEAVLQHGSADLTLVRLALRRCAEHVDAVLARVMAAILDNDPDVTMWEHIELVELVMHASDPAVLLAAVRSERPSVVLAAAVRVAEVGCEEAVRDGLLSITQERAVFAGHSGSRARHTYWVKAALCALPEDAAVTMLGEMLAQSDTDPRFTASVSEALETLLVSKPHSTTSRRVRILVRTLKAHATHAVVLSTKTIRLPAHLSRADRKAVLAVCRRVGIATSAMQSDHLKAHEATNAWEAAGIANGYVRGQVQALQLAHARVRLIENAAVIDPKLLIEATADASAAVRVASLVRLDDPAGWRAALLATGIDLSVLAKKAPVAVLAELWAQGRFVAEPAVILVMLRRCALSATEASVHPEAAVRLAAAFASTDEEVLVTLINGVDDQVALQASFRTARLEHWIAGITRIGTAPASQDTTWNRLVSIELPAREMDLRRGELARTAATSDPAVARAAIHSICDEPVLWSLQQHPALAEWATARLVMLTDTSS